ncbi:MAG: 6,7-dimethyl-8-ribityllumazine synthase [Pyrinomonadaceae bacterium]
MKTELKRSDISAGGLRFAIVVARWNDEFTSKLADGAMEALLGAGAERADIDIFHVPGAFELPVASLKAAKSGEYHAVIALGVVIRGDTPHFDYVAGQAAAGLMQASMQSGVPVMFGVITADKVGQVIERTGEGADNKGFEAAISAIETASTLSSITRAAKARFEVRKESYLNVA